VLLAIGGWVVTKRQPAAASTSASGAMSLPKPGIASSERGMVSRPGTANVTTSNAPAAKSSLLLEALKEELFQLEVERKEGKITPADYEKARAALDQTLDRALKRQSQA
jgi:hypothetical protein